MSYIGFENIPARTINRRIVAPLRKYYRADGSFDLFDINNPQMCCMKYLADRNEAGVLLGRTEGISLGTWSFNYNWGANESTFNTLGIYRADNYAYNSHSTSAILLKTDNSVGLYPYIIYLRNYSEHNSGWAYIRGIKNDGSEVTFTGGGGNQEITWSPTLNNAATMMDWKDYDRFYAQCYSSDGSKYTGNWTRLRATFIHRFTEDHPLYRYYT